MGTTPRLLKRLITGKDYEWEVKVPVRFVRRNVHRGHVRQSTTKYLHGAVNFLGSAVDLRYGGTQFRMLARTADRKYAPRLHKLTRGASWCRKRQSTKNFSMSSVDPFGRASVSTLRLRWPTGMIAQNVLEGNRRK